MTGGPSGSCRQRRRSLYSCFSASRSGRKREGAQRQAWSMHRREVLALLGALAGSSPMFAAYSRHTINPIGLQLYTVREALERNFEATLARVAAIGYREVEFAGYFGRSASEVRSSLRQTGLMAPSAHVPLEALGSSWGSVIENALAIGHRYLVVAA